MRKGYLYIFLLVSLSSIAVSANASKKESKDKNLGVVVLSSTNYDEEVSKGLVLVDYWASWCGPCRKLEPILKDVTRETGIKLGKLNIDNYKFFVSKQNVSTIPTLILYKDGKEVQRLVGLYSKEELLEVIKPYLDVRNK